MEHELPAKKKALLQQLYETYREKLVKYADVMLKNHADAEDAVQQAFLYVLERPQNLRGADNPETYHYLSVITKHKALDILREKSRLAGEEEIPEESCDPTGEEAAAL